MTIKIVEFSSPTVGVDPDMVFEVERLLERVKAGGVKGLAFATSRADGCYGTITTGTVCCGLVGAVECVKDQCLSVLRGSAVDDE